MNTITCQLSDTLGYDGNFLCNLSGQQNAQAYRFGNVDVAKGSIKITPGLVRTKINDGNPLSWTVMVDGYERSTTYPGQLVCEWKQDSGSNQKYVECTTEIDGVQTEISAESASLVCTDRTHCVSTDDNNGITQKRLSLDNGEYTATFSSSEGGDVSFTWPQVPSPPSPPYAPFAPVSPEFGPIICDSEEQECLFMRQGNIGEAYTWPSTINSTPATVDIHIGAGSNIPPNQQMKLVCEQVHAPDKYACTVTTNGQDITTTGIRQNNTIRISGNDHGKNDLVVTW